ncbi:PAS domain-containing protein [Cystobacter fuscus]
MEDPDYISGVTLLTSSARHMAFEHCSAAIVLLDPLADRFEDLNVAASHLLGYTRQELLTLPTARIFGHSSSDLMAFTQYAMEHGNAWSDRFTCRRGDGEELPVELSATHLPLKGRPHRC